MQPEVNPEFHGGSDSIDVGWHSSSREQADRSRSNPASHGDRLCEGTAANVPVTNEDDPSDSRPFDPAELGRAAEKGDGIIEQRSDHCPLAAMGAKAEGCA